MSFKFEEMSHLPSSSMQSLSKSYRSVNIKGYVPFFYDGIPSFPNEIPDGIKRYLPRFDRNQSQPTKKHVHVSSDLMYDCDVCHEDLWMRLFV